MSDEIKMLKAELLTRRDWLKIAAFVAAFGGLIVGLLVWLFASSPPPPESNPGL